MLSVDAVLEFLNKKNLVKSVLFVGSVFDFRLKAFQFVCFFSPWSGSGGNACACVRSSAGGVIQRGHTWAFAVVVIVIIW